MPVASAMQHPAPGAAVRPCPGRLLAAASPRRHLSLLARTPPAPTAYTHRPSLGLPTALAVSTPLAHVRHVSGGGAAEATGTGSGVAGAAASGSGSNSASAAGDTDVLSGLGADAAAMEQLKGLMAARDQVLVDASQWMVDWVPFLPALTGWVQAMPGLLGLEGNAWGPALAIAGITFVLRTCVSLPSILWARRRALRLTQVFWPEWAKARRDVPTAIMRDMKRTRTSSQQEFQLRVRKSVRTSSSLTSHMAVR